MFERLSISIWPLIQNIWKTAENTSVLKELQIINLSKKENHRSSPQIWYIADDFHVD